MTWARRGPVSSPPSNWRREEGVNILQFHHCCHTLTGGSSCEEDGRWSLKLNSKWKFIDCVTRICTFMTKKSKCELQLELHIFIPDSKILIMSGGITGTSISEPITLA